MQERLAQVEDWEQEQLTQELLLLLEEGGKAARKVLRIRSKGQEVTRCQEEEGRAWDAIK